MKFLFSLAVFSILMLFEIGVFPVFSLSVPPASASFFVISLYWLSGVALLPYALAAGVVYTALHAVSFWTLAIFIALAAFAAVFKTALTHQGPLHLAMFLGISFFIWQLLELIRLVPMYGAKTALLLTTSYSGARDPVFISILFGGIIISALLRRLWRTGAEEYHI